MGTKSKEQQHKHYVTWVSKPGSREKRNLADRRRRRRRREYAIAQYGGKCTCCGEDRYEFLAFDHVNNDGAAHRKTIKGGDKMVNYVFREAFPDNIQLLCHNCNISKGMYGYCPHKE